ncbi:MAG TPA: hypothetical protein PLU55_01720 [Candidatus Pacearchaeota archaeon]|nr:hypothetical protein [Candidatus Pacearchaeota archaeon]
MNLFEDDKTKIKVKIKPKFNTKKLIKEHEVSLEELQLGAEMDYIFDDTTSMNMKGKIIINNKDIKVNQASINFTKKF